MSAGLLVSSRYIGATLAQLFYTHAQTLRKKRRSQLKKHMGTWITTGMNKQVWKGISAKDEYSHYDGIINADAVFIPERLVERIHLAPVPPNGAFMVNCEKVKYGFCENLKVFDKTAFCIFLANIDSAVKTS